MLTYSSADNSVQQVPQKYQRGFTTGSHMTEAANLTGVQTADATREFSGNLPDTRLTAEKQSEKKTTPRRPVWLSMVQTGNMLKTLACRYYFILDYLSSYIRDHILNLEI